MSNPIGAQFRPEGFAGPRGLVALAREVSLAEVGHHVVRRRSSRRERRAVPYAGRQAARASQPVLLVPGFMAGDLTLRLLSADLRARGLRTYRSQIHANVGCTREAAEALERRLEAVALRRDRKVVLVGHSLGGMLARGVAARRPDLVAGIVTLGSPLLAPGAVHQALAWDLQVLLALGKVGVRGLMQLDCVAGECAELSFADSRVPMPEGVGFTTVFSRRDGIVDWKGCVDDQAEQVEVWASHCGMALDPRVFDVVAERVTRYGGAPVGERPLLSALPTAHAG